MKFNQFLTTGLFFCFILVFWELVLVFYQIPRWLIPAPSQIFKTTFEYRQIILPHLGQTLLESLLGFFTALVLGVGLASLISFFPQFNKLISPFLVFSQTIPLVVIVPILVIWFGYGLLPKIILITLMCFFPICLNTLQGLQQTDKDLLNLLKTMKATPWQIFFKVRIFQALPAFFSGLKISVVYSVIGAILAEWAGASKGLGVFITRSSNAFRTDLVFGATFLACLLSLILFLLVSFLGRKYEA